MIKKIFIILLVIVLVIPSYAAVSVSDGSAFVTKEELAMKTNNISNRISTLENSIEAKIDSQVSSYLSRNGIWTGDKQELVGDNSSWKYGYGRGPSDYCYILLTTNAKEADTATTSYGYQSKCPIIRYGGVDADKEGNLVNNITKTGLAIIKTSCTEASNHEQLGEKRTVVATVRKNGDYYYAHEDHFRFIFRAKAEFFQNSKKLSGVETEYTGQFAGASLEAPALSSSVLLMFVEKGMPLIIKYTSVLDNDADTPYSCTLRWFSGGESYRTWSVTDVSIY